MTSIAFIRLLEINNIVRSTCLDNKDIEQYSYYANYGAGEGGILYFTFGLFMSFL